MDNHNIGTINKKRSHSTPSRFIGNNNIFHSIYKFAKKIHFILWRILIEISPLQIFKRKRASNKLMKIGGDNLKLHIGCGPRVLKNWINIDLVYEKPDRYLKYYSDKSYTKKIRGTQEDFYPLDVTRKKWPIKDNSAEVIFHEDFFEHLDQRQQLFVLFESLRVMKKGAVHRINTPNLLKSEFVNTRFSNRKFVSKEWDEYFHKNICTPEYIKKISRKIGYKKVIFGSKNISTSKLIPIEYRPGQDRPTDGNIFVDLIK